MENHIRREGELVMPGSVVVYSFSVGMIVPEFRTDRNEFIGPPGDTDRMLRIVRGKASPATDLVVEIFVSHGKECVWCKPKHGVVDHRALGRLTVMDGKRAASKRHL